MGQLLHGSARTTAAVRRAIQHSQESLAKHGRPCIGAFRGMASAACRTSKATSRRGKSSSPIRSATSTSISPKFIPKKADSTCSSPLTAPASLPMPSCTKKPTKWWPLSSYATWLPPYPIRSIRCSPITVSSSPTANAITMPSLIFSTASAKSMA
jgi:hypothetical protein